MSGRLIILVCSTLSVATVSAADVRLRSAAVCGGNLVRVADVAEVFAKDDRLGQALAELPLCPTPAANRQRVLSQDDIRQLLEFSGVDRKSITITGSETVTVSGGDAAHATNTAKHAVVARGVRQAAFEVLTPPAPSVAKAAAARPALLPTSSQTSDETKPQPLPPLVEKGRSLSVLARSAGVQITTSGKALDAGSLGDMINVELLDTKQRVMARVTSPQSVELTTAASSDTPSFATAKN